jgi:LCP family protein required for cell wall assembly
MQPKKYDNFGPKRQPSIDGFFAKPTAPRQRQPVFRSPSANSQQEPAKLVDMPQRTQPQEISPVTPRMRGANSAQAAGSLEGRRRRMVGSQPSLAPEDVLAPETAPKKAKKERKKRWTKKRIFAVLGVLVLLTGMWFGFKFYKDISRITGNKNPLSLLGVFHPVPLKNQDGRVNILVAANSADDVGHNGANLTDSIMVLSINTKNNTALILSIPRDLWVQIGSSHAKINSAYPNGGMDKLQSVVEDNLGLTIDYQALVNYGAFRDLVNAVGSINITVKSDDPRGIYDPSLDYTTRTCCALAKYPNGPVTLNGKQALNLARARGDAYGSYGYAQSDFTRTMYQREMLVAIKDKASSTSVVANPLKLTSLIDAVGNNVKTDLSVAEIETLYSDTKKIDDTKIDSYNINTLMGKNTTMLANYTSPDGQSALIPAAGIDDFTAIKAQINKILTSDPIAKEGSNVVVLNGTTTTGLALQQENKLAAKGMTVSIGDSPATQATTTIVDDSNAEMPNTLTYLKKKYNATVVVNASLTRAYPGADFIVILGQSAAPATTTTTTGQ